MGRALSLAIAVCLLCVTTVVWAGTTYVNFDDEAAGPFRTAGGVTFSAGKAVIASNGLVKMPWFPTTSNENVTAEFTIHNVQSVLAQGSISIGWEAGFLPVGVVKCAGSNYQPMVGSFDYTWLNTPGACIGHGEVIPSGTQKMSIKLVTNTSTNVTTAYAAYDGYATTPRSAGTFHQVATFAWGNWTSDRSLQILTYVPSLTLDDVIITSTSVPDYSSNHHAYFDDGTPGAWITSGAVTYSSGQANIGYGGQINFPWFPTSTNQTFSTEYTVHNVQYLHSQATVSCGQDQGGLLAGFIAKCPATNYQLMVGAFDAQYFNTPGAYVNQGVVIPSYVQKMTVRTSVNVLSNETEVFVGYDNDAASGSDPGRLFWAASWAWGTWSSQRSIVLANYWVSSFQVDDVKLSWSNTPAVTYRNIAQWKAKDVATGSGWYTADSYGNIPSLNLWLNRSDAHGDPYSFYASRVASSTNNRKIVLALCIPIDATGWQWWDNPTTYRTIGSSGTYQTVNASQLSKYPIAVISKESKDSRALCIGAPIIPARAARFVYDASAKELRAEYDLGLSNIPDNLNLWSDVQAIAFEVYGENAFRQALDCYYSIYYPEVQRIAGQGGTHLTKDDLSTIPNPADFHFAWHDFTENAMGYVTADTANGVQSFLYREPHTNWRQLRQSLSSNEYIDFNNGTPGSLIVDGGVTFSNGRAIIPAGAGLRVPGFPTASPETLVCEFTVQNLADFLPRTDEYEFGWYGRWVNGVRKTAGTGQLMMVGAHEYGTGVPFDAEIIYGTSKMTVKMVVCSAETHSKTYCYVGYDINARNGTTPGELHLAGLYDWGTWTSGAGYSELAIRNWCWQNLIIDDVVIKRYSGAVPSATYANYVAQMEEDAAEGDLEAQPTVTSGSFLSNGNYDFILGAPSWGGPFRAFMINTSSEVPVMASHPTWQNKNQFMLYTLDKYLGWTKGATGVDGMFHDSIDCVNFGNYRTAQWETTTYPLGFDRNSGNALCQLNIMNQVADADSLSANLHSHNQLFMANWPYSYCWYLMPYVDISGYEYNYYSGTGGAFQLPSDDQELQWRSLSVRRPIWLMANCDNYNNIYDVEKFMQHCMFYGIFPTAFHGSGTTYFSTPAWYDRDRSLWNLYVPIIQDLDNAGWQPVPYAMANPTTVRLERFGHGSTDDMTITLHNTSTSQVTVDVTLQRYELGLTGTVTVSELMYGTPVSVVANDSWTTTFRITLPGDGYRAVAVDQY